MNNSANKYRQLARQKAELQELEVSSGFVFKVRELDIEYLMLTEQLPTSITGFFVKQNDKISQSDTGIDEAGFKAGVDLINFVVEYVTVEPKIVRSDPKEDELLKEDVLPEDLFDIVQWALGGELAESLLTFRQKRKQGSLDSPDSEKRGDEAEQFAGNRSQTTGS